MGKFARINTRYKSTNTYIPKDIDSFTQININETIEIPESRPLVDEILNIDVRHEIKNSKIVKTAKGTSLEGQNLTGWKYLLEGVLNIRIDYCDKSSSAALYTIRKDLPFSNATTLSEDTSYTSRFIDNIEIEDVFYELQSESKILVNISFLFGAEIC